MGESGEREIDVRAESRFDGELEERASEEGAVLVPAEALSEAALQGLLEEFASRDGTDYGDVERSLAAKVAELRAGLQRGEIGIAFDPESERTQLVTLE